MTASPAWKRKFPFSRSTDMDSEALVACLYGYTPYILINKACSFQLFESKASKFSKRRSAYLGPTILQI